MPKRPRSDEWDEAFSLEKAKTVTLRDRGGKLGFFKDMFAIIPPQNDDPIEVELEERYLRVLLSSLREAYTIGGPTQWQFRAHFCRTFGAEELAAYYVWFKKYQFDKFAAAALASFHIAELHRHPWQEGVAVILGLAQDANDIQLARAALAKSHEPFGSLKVLVDKARMRLSTPWLIALLYGILDSGGGGWSSKGLVSDDYAKVLSDNFAQQLEKKAEPCG